MGDVVIDVSNVCWSRELPPRGRRPPVWARLERLVEAWRAEHGSSVKVLLVADNSLAHALQGDDRRKFAELRHSGELQTATVADGLVLNLARQNRMHVLSDDQFKDLRREHPWIEKAPERFHSWTMDGGRIRFVPSGIRPLSPMEMSAAEEAKEVGHERGLDPRRTRDRKILLTSWRCDADPCPLARTRLGQLLVWPRLDPSGRAVCPECGVPLTELGPRLPTREMVVEDLRTGGEITRFLIEDGFPIVVGRGTAVGGVNLLPADRDHAKALLRVSRQHLLLRLDAPNGSQILTAVDLDSHNGTEVARRDGTAFLPPRRLAPDVETRVSLADRLILGGTIALRASGRRFRADVPPPAHPAEAESTVDDDL